MSQTFTELVETKLSRLFAEIAKEVSKAEITEEVAAGLPFELFRAEQHMIAQWREYVEGIKTDWRTK